MTLHSKTLLAAATLALVLSGCSGRDDELDAFIAATKKEGGGDVAPLPEVKPYQSFTYEAQSLRSPFLPGSPGGGAGAQSVRPDSKRNREFLEQFSLDTLRMVGTLKLGGHQYGLVKTKDGLVHRVLPGNHLGQSEGKIVTIEPSRISLVEIVPDGLGGYMERPASLALNE
ncbi:MAG: pilus assembly protein PilP [Sinobacteraceae bacterium]|nr:pilus assembly protein PilP [Nevskiaceae bacterium]MCP5470642.1 pilus assembly protein PilP [Nevskiaceae bacterium]